MTNGDLPTNVFTLRQSEFRAIPGSPWVYWIPDILRDLFSKSTKLSNIAEPRAGMHGGDRFRFARYWWEVSFSKIARHCRDREEITSANKKWVPYMKGGSFHRWYGNQEWVVAFDQAHYRILSEVGNKLPSRQYYFKEGITYSAVSSSGFSGRISPGGFIFDAGGSSLFPKNLPLVLACLNSEFIGLALRLINPTINIQAGDIARLPMPQGSNQILNEYVPEAIWISLTESTNIETTYDFITPFGVYENNEKLTQWLRETEERIDLEVCKTYGLSQIEKNNIIDSLNSSSIEDIDQNNPENNDDETFFDKDKNSSKAINIISYIVGIVLGRFSIGIKKKIGNAIYERDNFSVGSLGAPTVEIYNELVGNPSQFAYVDEQGGRHVFSRPVEQALQKLALTDGIAVFDPNHPRDLPTLVSKALELMLGQAQAQEVIRQAAGGDLRKFLEKDFFTQHHIKQYRKRPVYWPIQSSKRSYGFILFHEKIDRNTFYALQQEPYLPTKRRAVQLRLEELGKKVLTAQGAARKPIEKEMDELRQLAEELAQFAKDLDAITRGGYEPEADWIDDGVILRMAPLWSVIPLWKSEPKKYWEELAAGKYDWSRIAMKYWPERVKQACKKNKSYAIAHGHEEWHKGG